MERTEWTTFCSRLRLVSYFRDLPDPHGGLPSASWAGSLRDGTIIFLFFVILSLEMSDPKVYMFQGNTRRAGLTVS